MNAKFEWFGLSVARKHVYFYAMLLLATLAVHTMKDQLVDGSDQDKSSFAELSRITEHVAILQAASSQP